MALPTEPVTLSVGAIQELNRKLSDARHDINNNLSLMVAALELVRYRMKRGTVLEAWEKLKAGNGAIPAPLLQDFEAKLKEQLEQTERMVNTLSEQPPRISETLKQFSREFEQAMGIKRSQTAASSSDQTSPNP